MKRLVAAALFAAAVLLSLSSPAAAQTTRTFSLIQGDTMTPASPVTDLTGVTTYYNGFVTGRVESPTPTTFSYSLAFRGADPTQVPGVYSGTILTPSSSFAVTEASGRKSVSTSGTIDAGTVTYRLLPDGRADIISVVSGNLTIWQGKNKSRKAVGYGSINYGTPVAGAGSMALYFY